MSSPSLRMSTDGHHTIQDAQPRSPILIADSPTTPELDFIQSPRRKTIRKDVLLKWQSVQQYLLRNSKTETYSIVEEQVITTVDIPQELKQAFITINNHIVGSRI